MVHAFKRLSVLGIASLALLATVSGCNLLGAAGALVTKLPKPPVAASYQGLQNQSVGVMVWIDRGMSIDWATLQQDLANSIEGKLKLAQTTGESKDLKGTTFPVMANSIIRYQREHPATAVEDIKDVAPNLKVSRLIYVEVVRFSTRSPNAMQLFLGRMECKLQLIEVANGRAKVAFTETIPVQYPDKQHAGPEGLLNKDDRTMYVGTVGEMSTEIAKRFFEHPDDTP